MSKQSHVEFEGAVSDVKAGDNFSITLEDGREVGAKLSGKMRHNKIRIVLGDRVTVAFSVYDAKNGIITFRHR